MFRCHCNDGFVRDAENKCIKKYECPGEEPSKYLKSTKNK